MDHNLSIYGIGMRYILSIICGVIGGLIYSSNAMIGIPLLTLSVVFFLEGILAFDPIMSLLGKNSAKSAVDDFQ